MDSKIKHFKAKLWSLAINYHCPLYAFHYVMLKWVPCHIKKSGKGKRLYAKHVWWCLKPSEEQQLNPINKEHQVPGKAKIVFAYTVKIKTTSAI